MLRMGYLVVGVFDPYSHSFKGEDCVPPQVFRSIQRIIKITAFIERLGPFICPEIKIFKFGSYI